MIPSAIPEITPEELARAIDADEQLQIIDVRAPEHVAAGRIDIAPEHRSRNVRGSTLLSTTSLQDLGISSDPPIVVVCGRGNDSAVVAQHLNGLGVRARSLAGGMAAWMKLSVPRRLESPPALDSLVQFDRVGKGALSYLLISAGEALIIDPPRDIRPHMHFIDDAKARLVAVADTHVHADYISGGPQVSHEHGIPYYLHPDDAIYPYDETPGKIRIQAVREGMGIPVGRCEIAVVHTPGHSPGSVTYLVDRRGAFTGDFLFISSIGRPDLAARTEEWSVLLWKSLQRAKTEWPADLMIYPAHYASQGERRRDRTIGAELSVLLSQNESLRKADWPEFMIWIRQHEATIPEAYKNIKAVNIGLLNVDDREVENLEFGRSECAIG
jgi:glyoxylase-like metal-dependent hydrolase (beta-lactamase superfamily II)